jgi:anti-repressor protein
MNKLKIFKNEQFGEIRTIIEDEQLWFVAQDISKILDYSETSVMLRRLDIDETMKIVPTEIVGTNSMAREVTVINESGLYNAVLGSKKPEARKFKKWVTSEVLPDIRKHGAYMTDDSIEKALTDPDFLIQLATNLKEEKLKRLDAEKRIEIDRPKVIFADALEISDNTILVGELAKLLKQNGIDIGQNRLFEKLREMNYLGTKGEYKNLPTQKAMDLKLFEIKKRTINNPDGSVRVTTTTKVTGKGQIYFVNKFKI